MIETALRAQFVTVLASRRGHLEALHEAPCSAAQPAPGTAGSGRTGAIISPCRRYKKPVRPPGLWFVVEGFSLSLGARNHRARYGCHEH